MPTRTLSSSTRVALLIITLSFAPALPAQSRQPISLQLSGLYARPFGGDYKDFDVGSGFGAEAQLRYTPGALSIGAGFQFTTHNGKDYLLTLEDETPVDVTRVGANLFGLFIEPRYVLFVGSDRVAPYVSARLSMLHYGSDASWNARTQPFGGTMSWNTSGFTANGGGGVLVRLNARTNLDLGATYGYSTFGTYRLKVSERSGLSAEDRMDGGHGSNVVIRLGLAVGLGR